MVPSTPGSLTPCSSPGTPSGPLRRTNYRDPGRDGSPADAPPTWDLTSDLGPPDRATLRRAIDDLVDAVTSLTRRYDELGVGPAATGGPPEVAEVAGLLDAHNAVLARQRTVSAVLYGRVSVDSRDAEAVALRSELQTRTVAIGRLTTRLQAWVAALPLDRLAAESPGIRSHRYPLERAATLAGHQMGPEAEELAGELRASGSVAWANLHRDVTAHLEGTLRVEGEPEVVVPVGALRAMATEADPVRRAAAHAAETEAWAGAQHVLAGALNGAVGERVVLDRRRGWPDHLAAALFANGVDAPALRAMQGAVLEALPDFHRYLRAKASLLGHAGALPWWDLLAPVGEGSARTWAQAVDQVLGAFAGFDPGLHDLAHRAVTERWIDAEPRVGKVGGAFCVSLGDGTSRLLVNFDGSTDGMLSLAHELGHAYHGHLLADRTPLQRQTPMTLAETASVFCETITLEAALQASGPAEELALLDLDLAGATQIVVDIQSRFWFEEALVRRRAERELSPDELCAAMLDAQGRAYGDAIDPAHRHRWMWAVKSHYFTPFYNWPYTFGLLFGLGLHAVGREHPEGFRQRYADLLACTGTAAPAELAGRFGIDLTDPTFWREALAVIVARVDRYVTLAASVGAAPGE